MYFHTSRIFLITTLLICLTQVMSVIPTAATQPFMNTNRYFGPGGYGVAIPQKISTATTPQRQSRETGQEKAIFHPTANVQATIRNPQNIVNVPPPTSTDPSAIAGVSYNGGKPDTNGAGGPYNFLEPVNPQIAIYSRSGSLQYSTNYQTWFKAPNVPKFYDPVAIWDNIGGRFIFSIETGGTLRLSIAMQANALGNYCNYTFYPPSGLGFDFDKLGVNNAGVYFTANLFNSHGMQVSNELFYAERTQLESCGRPIFIYWIGLTNPDGSLAGSIVPAVQNTVNAGGNEYLVNSYSTGACTLTLWTLTSQAKLSNVAVPTQCYSPPPPAPQKGSAATIDSGDCSLYQVSYVNGLLTLATEGEYDWADGNGPVGIVEWFVLNPGSATVSSQGAFGTPGYSLLYPAAIRNSVGNMLFVYNATGPTIYPSIWYVNQTFINSQVLAWGTSYYFTSGLSPWGDYQSAWPDSGGSSPNGVWITGEYAKGPVTWGSEFGLVVP